MFGQEAKLDRNDAAKAPTGGLGRFARVVDVIVDAFHPKYKDYGESNSINGIFYVGLGANSTEDEEEPLSFAYQGNGNIKITPLIGEIVELDYKPYWEARNSGGADGKGLDAKATTVYWTRIVPIWNHPHHNADPDSRQNNDSPNDFGDDFEESDKVNPLQPFPGDILIEGRHANTVRFGGTKHSENSLVDESNNGSPYIITRIGQTEDTENGFETVVEDINKDLGSIYMMSDHEVPIEPANDKRDSYEEEPEKPDKYKGEQVVVNSNRLFLNAKEDSVLMSAGSSVGANAETINLDGEKMVSLDAKKIYLGVAALKNEDEPVLKGSTSTEWMEEHVSLFQILIEQMSKMPAAPAAAVAIMKAAAAMIKPQVGPLKKRLKTLHSKKVFTE